MTHWTDEHMDRLGEILAAARNLIDLELSEEIPESIKPEWQELALKLNALTRGNP
jgi:hypothetical protein